MLGPEDLFLQPNSWIALELVQFFESMVLAAGTQV